MNKSFRENLSRAFRVIHGRFPILVPWVLLLLITLLLEATGSDLAISTLFYDQQSASWPQADQFPWEMIDEWCVFPGVIMGVVATIWGVIALAKWQWNWKSRGAILLTWALVIGPGLLVNGSMKPFFSRPRPREVTQLGGPKTYLPPWGQGEKVHFNSSFPSGHASIGFLMIAPAFVCRKRRARVAWMTFGLLYGGLMSLSRIVQGGHFLSDTLWSLAIVYTTCFGLAVLILAIQLQRIRGLSSQVPEENHHTERLAA